MRNLKALHTIPAHKSNISDIRFFRKPHKFSPNGSSTGNEMNVDTPEEEEDIKPTISATATDGAVDIKPTQRLSDPQMSILEEDYQSGLYFVSSGYDGIIKLWDIGQRSAVYSNSSSAEVWGFDWQPVGANSSAVGKQFAIAGDDKAVTLYRAAGSACFHKGLHATRS